LFFLYIRSDKNLNFVGLYLSCKFKLYKLARANFRKNVGKRRILENISNSSALVIKIKIKNKDYKFRKSVRFVNMLQQQ